MNFKMLCDGPDWPMGLEAVLEYPETIILFDKGAKTFDKDTGTEGDRNKKIDQNTLKINIWTEDCRETMVNIFKVNLECVKVEGNKRVSPNFSRKISSIVLGRITTVRVRPIVFDIELYSNLLRRLCSITLEKIFPGSTNKISVKLLTRELQDFTNRPYGSGLKYKIVKTTVVRFPTLYLSNPGTLSLFLSLVRKVTHLLNSKSRSASELKNLILNCPLEELEKIFVRMNYSYNDPFNYDDSVILSEFPLDFLHFLASKREEVFSGGKYWFLRAIITGWQSFSYYLLDNSIVTFEELGDFLIERYPERKKEILQLISQEYRA